MIPITKNTIYWMIKTGFVTIGMIMGFGVIFFLNTLALSLYVKSGNLTPDLYQFYNYLQISIGLGIVFYWVIYQARERKCPNCNAVLNKV